MNTTNMKRKGKKAIFFSTFLEAQQLNFFASYLRLHHEKSFEGKKYCL